MTTNPAAPRRRIPKRMTYSQSVEAFLKDSSHWLTPGDAPAIAILRNLAAELDGPGAIVPALVAQFGMAFRALQKREPGPAVEKDELDGLLDDAPGS